MVTPPGGHLNIEEIVVIIGDPFPAGDNLLTVSTGNGQSQYDEYDLTFGMVGLQSVKGSGVSADPPDY